MKTFFFFSLIIFPYSVFISARGINGGMSCAVCTVLTGVLMQVAEIHEEDIFNASKRICYSLPNFLEGGCDALIDHIQPYVNNISEKITPDVFCMLYGTCELDNNNNLCHLFPLSMTSAELAKQKSHLNFPKIDVCSFPVISDICKILTSSFISLNPIEDFDKDGFSALATGRGFDWRGKDCADNDPNIYPGRFPLNSDFSIDSNCNGIWGFDNATIKSYEHLFCKKYQSRGLIYIGDSIGAHFHMPDIWINPLLFNLPGLNLSNVILDEIDFPQFGFASGFQNITSNILIEGKTDSLYLRLRNRNRCNHRDYQNLAQNGASSFEGISHVTSVSRNQTNDNPALVIYAMQGNDVCNNFNDTINNMTSPKNFRQNVMKSLSLLDQKLPFGSHVVLIGLVEADFIFPAMANRIHPIGKLHNNVFYKNVYEWFNCLQIGPCTGWLNSNETLRNITTLKAQHLSRILKSIATNAKFVHFNLHYIKNPITYLVKQKKINISQFLESVDSLHPNQAAQPLIAEIVWKFLEKLPLNVLGPINPNNDKIIDLFGDQGGH